MKDAVSFERLKRYLPAIIGVPALLVAGAVGIGVQSLVISGYGRMVMTGLNGFVLQSYDVEGLTPDSAAARASFSDTVEMRREQGILTSVVLTDRAGRVIYSSDPSATGKTVSIDGAAHEALEGKVTTRVVWRGGHEYLTVIGPAQLTGSSSPDGVIDMLRPIGPLRTTLLLSVSAVIGTVLLGAALSWLLLLWVIGRARSELDESHAHAAAIDRRLEASLAQLAGHSVGTLQALTQAVDAKDSYTAMHSLHVADYACALARQMGLDEEVVLLERAGLLHDVGKIGLPESILQKPGPLTAEEFATVKEHSRVGAEIIASIPTLNEVMPVVLHHHERWDGRGYPDGLAGADIPRDARILAVVDAFDAMTTTRPYHGAMTFADARIELAECSGKHFEPALVDAFLQLLDSGQIAPKTGAEGRSVG